MINKRYLCMAMACFLSSAGGHICTAEETGAAETAESPAEERAEGYRFDEIVVTATRTPVEGAKVNANVTTITAEEIEQRHYTDVTQALRDVPGVIVNQYAPAGYSNTDKIYINGSDSVVVLVDGVRQNFAGGSAASLTNTMKSMSGIERIEVLRGSASTLYGSDAKGGVINIITKKADHTETMLKAAYGSYGTGQYGASVSGAANGWDWRAMYQKDKSNDFKDAHGDKTPSGMDADSVDFHIGKQLDSVSDLALNFHSFHDNDRYQGLFEKRQGLAVNHAKYDRIGGNIIWNAEWNETTKNRMTLERSEYQRNLVYHDAWGGGTSDLDVRSWKFSDQFDKKLGDHLLTAGFEFTKDATEGYTSDLLNRSYYVQDQWRILPLLSLTAGIRHDRNSAFGTHNSPSVNLGYDLTPSTHAYISYSEYFLTPTPYDLFDAQYGNPRLKPESGNTKEVGLSHDFGSGFNASAHYFKRHSKDRIGYDAVTYVSMNVGDEDAHGWDIQLAKKFDDHVSARLGYTHTSVGAVKGRAANMDGYLPKGQWTMGVDYANRAFDASLLARGMIDRPGPFSGNGNAFPASSYWVFDLALNYQVTKEAKIYLKVNNLFDQFYVERSNVPFGGAGQWWTAPGRHFLMGMEYSF